MNPQDLKNIATRFHNLADELLNPSSGLTALTQAALKDIAKRMHEQADILVPPPQPTGK